MNTIAALKQGNLLVFNEVLLLCPAFKKHIPVMKMFYLPQWRLFLLSVMLISGVSITAQAQCRMQVTGTVRRDQGDLLPNASVVALNEKTKYTAGVVTDSNGCVHR